MSKKTIGLIVGLVFLTVILVVLAVQTSQPTMPIKPTENTTKPSIASEAKTRLYLTPNPVTLSGNTASTIVMMDSQDNEVTAVQMEFAYDPTVLSFVSITPSALFAKSIPLVNTIDKKNGRISYALGFTPEQANTPHTGTAEVATLVFTRIGAASGSASTEITFLPKSLVSAHGINQSVLKEATGTTVQFAP